MLLLDLCSGAGGVTNVFKRKGWEVISVDYNPDFHPDIVADIINWQYDGDRPDLIWGSPECTQFSKESMPMSWACNRIKPPAIDLRLALNVYRTIREQQPRFWVIENVRGARGYFDLIFGKMRKRVGPQYLWEEFPIFDTKHVYGKERLGPCPDRAAIRSLIPEGITMALEQSIRWELI